MDGVSSSMSPLGVQAGRLCLCHMAHCLLSPAAANGAGATAEVRAARGLPGPSVLTLEGHSDPGCA